MKKAALLSLFLLASCASLATAGEGRPYAPYTHYPYYPSGWYTPVGPQWIQWWGLREPYTPPSGTAWVANPLRSDLPVSHVPAPNCDSPTIQPYNLGYRPPLGIQTAPVHDVQVTTPCTSFGSWQWSLKWLHK